MSKKSDAAAAAAERTSEDSFGQAQPGSPYSENIPRWSPPSADQEFVFDGLDSLPDWADRNWASYDRGPALAVPAGDIYGKAPYTTKTVRIGGTVRFVAATASKAAHFEVIEGEGSVDAGTGTLKPAQQSNASLEDMLKTGHMHPSELGTDAAAQVAQRSPELQGMIEGTVEPPAQVAPAVTAVNTEVEPST